MNISQTYSGDDSHRACSEGVPANYPIDEACEDTGRSYVYCPCDEMIIISLGTGKFTGKGCEVNDKGSYVLKTTGTTIKPEKGFYVDKDFTTIYNSHGLIFENLP